jgi:hypothetical protein
MDQGVATTQRIVIAVAVILGITIVFTIGYSLYKKAKLAESELANKVALDNATKKKNNQAGVSLTGESKNTSGFTYDGLVQKKNEEEATTTSFEVVNEKIPEEVPPEIPAEIPEPEPIAAPTKAIVKPVIKPKPALIYNEDRPLTAEEILRIRQLPVDNSPSGNLQTSLEEESQGQYKARY